MEDAKEEIQQLEEDPPEKLEDWPDGQAKYETFGGAEGDHCYDEGPEAKLGPDSVRHHEDGWSRSAARRPTTPTSSRASRSPAARPTRTPRATRTSSGSRTTTRTSEDDAEDTSEDTSDDDEDDQPERLAPPSDGARRLAGSGSAAAAARRLVRSLSASPPRGVSGCTVSAASPPGPTGPDAAADAALLDVPHERGVGLGGVVAGSAARAAAGAPCAARAARAPSDGTTTQRLRFSMPSAIACAGLRQRIGLVERTAASSRAAGRCAGCASAAAHHVRVDEAEVADAHVHAEVLHLGAQRVARTPRRPPCSPRRRPCPGRAPRPPARR